jgi:predicted nucleic acid-binding protein
LIAERAPLALTEMVVAELLAGARSPDEAKGLRRRLGRRTTMLALHGMIGFEAAAALVRHCRRRGVSAGVPDCLVAVPTIWAGARLLHADAHFDGIAGVSALEIHPLDAA